MPQAYCAVRAVPLPFVLRGGGSTSSSVQLAAPVTLTWQSGSADTWTPGPAFVVAPAASYGLGSPGVDTTAANWLIVAVAGSAAPVLAKEQDFPALDTVLGGTSPHWAALYLVCGTQIVPLAQRMNVGGLPTPLLDSAVLAVDPATHQATWLLPNPGDLLIGSISPLTRLPVWERLPVPASGSGQVLTYDGLGVVDWEPLGGQAGGAKGDILRFNGATWERYAITSGPQNSVLLNDRSGSGLPIWSSFTLPANPVISTQAGPVVTAAVGNNNTGTVFAWVSVQNGAFTSLGGAKSYVLNLWSGGTNAAPPPAWYLYQADESAWTTPPAQADAPGAGPAGFWTSVSPAAAGQQILLRQHFPLPPGTITSATFSLSAVGCIGLAGFLNGWAISPGTFRSGATLPLGTGVLVPGQDNVVAIQAQAASGATGYISCILTLQYQ
jgi:hypothetical protein